MKIPILMYHRICATVSSSRYAVSAREFKRQMEALRDDGYRVVPLAEAVATLKGARDGVTKTTCVTFDDGFKETYDYAVPTLEKFGYPATFFLVSALMGGTNAWERDPESQTGCALMDWHDAARLAAAGFDLGSHSRTHPILPELSETQAASEVRGSKRDLEERLGVPVRHFAYPYGRFDRRTRDLVSGAGYEAACSTLSGFGTRENDCFALRRIEVFGWDSTRAFLRKIKFGANEFGPVEVFGYYIKRGLSRFGGGKV